MRQPKWIREYVPTVNQLDREPGGGGFHPLFCLGRCGCGAPVSHVSAAGFGDYGPRGLRVGLFGEGGPAQAYVVVRMPKVDKPLRIVDLPFETDVENPNYMPELGTSDCLSLAKDDYPSETFWFKFTEEGKLVVEHRNVMMNCGNTTLESSVSQEGPKLVIMEEEDRGADSLLALCRCFKNVAYAADVVVDSDSLQVELHTSTTEMGPRVVSFKIPNQGSGEVFIRSW